MGDGVAAAVDRVAAGLDEDVYVLAPDDQQYLLLEAALSAVAGFLLQAFVEGVKQAVTEETAGGLRAVFKTLRGRIAGLLGRGAADPQTERVIAEELRELAERRSPRQLRALADGVQVDFQRALLDEGMSARAAVALAQRLHDATVELLQPGDDDAG